MMAHARLLGFGSRCILPNRLVIRHELKMHHPGRRTKSEAINQHQSINLSTIAIDVASGAK